MDVLLRPAEVIGLGFDHSWKSIKVSKVHGPMAANLIADTTPNGDVHPAVQFLPHQSLGLTNRWITILRETLFLLVAGVGDSPLIQYSSYPSTYGKVEPFLPRVSLQHGEESKVAVAWGYCIMETLVVIVRKLAGSLPEGKTTLHTNGIARTVVLHEDCKAWNDLPVVLNE